MTPFAADFPPSRRASLIAALRVLIDPSQVASFAVTRLAATMPGSFDSVMRCSLRRLAIASQLASANTGTIQNT